MESQHPRDIALANDIAAAIRKTNRPVYYALAGLTVLNLIVLAVIWSRSGGAESRLAATTDRLDSSTQEISKLADNVKAAAATNTEAAKALDQAFSGVSRIQPAVDALNKSNESLQQTAKDLYDVASRIEKKP
jgi:septal ring factor EnvC (AmiA/AmiB activator)